MQSSHPMTDLRHELSNKTNIERLIFMKKNIYYFGLLFFLCSSFFAHGIEVNADSFVKADREEEEEESFELSAPNMGRVYTKEKVMIKRDLSSLDSAVDSLEEEQIKKPKKPTKPKTNKRKPASLNHPFSADYGDMEIRWQEK